MKRLFHNNICEYYMYIIVFTPSILNSLSEQTAKHWLTYWIPVIRTERFRISQISYGRIYLRYNTYQVQKSDRLIRFIRIRRQKFTEDDKTLPDIKDHMLKVNIIDSSAVHPQDFSVYYSFYKPLHDNMPKTREFQIKIALKQDSRGEAAKRQTIRTQTRYHEAWNFMNQK